ncbi:MAG: hypothetical protein IJP96_05185 [Synergistaceae bacterium]|nr:hypothetical protein [Synergistaceae bacterium]MBR0075125.1 hypothetical protein [Synergistaceae bacterium]MBR0234353.1 hypothetical protein [Synergistaceae bacterium]
MIPINSAWHNKIEVKKGDYGENIVQRHFEKQGYLIYKSISDGAHPFDFLCVNNKETFFVEVKTKAKRNKYPDTGFNLRHYKIYKEYCERESKRMYICFVDPVLNKVYGNFLDILDKERIITDEVGRRLYPSIETARYNSVGTEIIYFHLSVMEHVADLTKEQLNDLQKIYS